MHFSSGGETAYCVNMNGLTVAEIGEHLGISAKAAKQRLFRAGIAPVGYAGPTAIYAFEVVEAIRNTPPPGRPKKKTSEE
jgi:hypothetical protein